MDEYKKLFANIGSKNEYFKVAVLLIFVMFILSSVLGMRVTIIIGVIAIIFIFFGFLFFMKRIFPK